MSLTDGSSEARGIEVHRKMSADVTAYSGTETSPAHLISCSPTVSFGSANMKPVIATAFFITLCSGGRTLQQIRMMERGQPVRAGIGPTNL